MILYSVRTLRGLAVLFLSSFLSAQPSFASDTTFTTLDRVEASVNQVLILLSDIIAFRRTLALRGQLDPLFMESKLSKRGGAATDEDIVQFLVDEQLILQSFPVSNQDVETEINSIQANNRIDRKTLAAALRSQGHRFEDYFELIRSSIAKKMLVDRDIRTRVFISDEEVKNYYVNSIRGSLGSKASYRIRILSTPAGNDENIKRAEAAIREGESFESVARRLSNHPSAKAGGDLGFLAEDEIAQSIAAEVRKLKVGEVSPPFGSTQSGYFLVNLEEVRMQPDPRFEREKETIRAKLAGEEYVRQIGLWLDKQRLSSFVRFAGQAAL